jgi:hypothetical protein
MARSAALRTAAVLGTLAVLTTAGCAARPAPTSALAPTRALAPTSAPTPTAAAAGGLHLPIEAYLLTPAQGAELSWEENTAIRTCMAAFGFDYPQAEPRPGPGSGSQYAVMYRRYGVVDPASVARWGYHLPSAVTGGREPAASAPAVLPLAEREVLMGADPATGVPTTDYRGRPVPAGGCRTAGTGLFPGVDSPQGPGAGPGELLSQLKSDSFTASMADPRVLRVFAAWDACMDARGYHLPDNPLDAAEDLTSLNDPAPDRAEIAQAEADVACKQRTNLVGVWFAVESDYQDAAIHRNQSALDQLRRQRDQDVRTVQRLSGVTAAS